MNYLIIKGIVEISKRLKQYFIFKDKVILRFHFIVTFSLFCPHFVTTIKFQNKKFIIKKEGFPFNYKR